MSVFIKLIHTLLYFIFRYNDFQLIFRYIICTSRFPGTTLDMIDIPLDEKSFMFDTPGIIQSHQMTNYVSENELKIIIPKNEIKQRVYQSMNI
jgi:ribosome biogenesis GTPase A